ncbi:hypothetical protein BpHYR1_018945 [Brachionus plicatilis]|uniref:Uncharacterized protein n=1 Tax=Brachionus plicatilis TaxID=10195 RepID=A0A3M7PUW8_BRAPC|nr:hypothetical protein BpHYR1_018945 [Brachionus plicatilis]
MLPFCMPEWCIGPKFMKIFLDLISDVFFFKHLKSTLNFINHWNHKLLESARWKEGMLILKLKAINSHSFEPKPNHTIVWPCKIYTNPIKLSIDHNLTNQLTICYSWHRSFLYHLSAYYHSNYT